MYIHIYAQLCLNYSILTNTKIFQWTQHTCLSTDISVFALLYVCMYASLPVYLLGRAAAELVSTSYMPTNILGKFYDRFSE